MVGPIRCGTMSKDGTSDFLGPLVDSVALCEGEATG
jgi:hypothetical protein